ncbi:MAG: CRISPR-associated endonuclease Cas3'' [candidate division WOR-3 bacterium]
MNEYYSHPGKIFENHLTEIQAISERLIDILGPEKDETKKFYKKIIKYFAFFHDLGKLTKSNQERIKKGEKLAHPHSIYGGIIFRLFCENTEFSKELTNKEKRIIYFIIRYHHTSFSDFWNKDELIEREEYKKEYIEEILHVLADFSSLFYKFFSLQQDKVLYSIKNQLSKLLEKVKKDEINIASQQYKYSSTIDDYIDVLFISSISFLADRLSANNNGEEFLKKIEEEINIEKYSKLEEKLKFYLSQLPHNEEIDKVRKECHDEVIQNFEKVNIQNLRIFRISLPTGIGKTYIGIRMALSIAKKYKLPVIYSLPFINIIEQTDINFKKIFGEKNVEKLHHLVFLENLGEEDIEEVINFKISPILITTFFQVFASLFPPARSFILKFPILINSCLILDELQSFNPEFYSIFEKIIEKIIERGFKLRVILMSATLPPLFKNAKDLTKDLKEKYYSKFNRYKMSFKGEIEIEEYKKYLLEKIINTNKKRIGIICNKVEEAREIFIFLKKSLNCNQLLNLLSIKSSTEFSEKIKKLIEDVYKANDFSPEFKKLVGDFLQSIDSTLKGAEVIYSYNKEHNIQLLYLAANLIDGIKIERVKFLIELMENLKNKKEREKKLIVVSTQVIEAGVDFDFDMMFRDFAPFDSLIQSSGRVNRSANNPLPEEIEIWEVFEERENKKYSYSPIYSAFLISHTKQVIPKNKILEEKDILEIMYKYLEKVEYLKNQDKYESIIEGLKFIEIRTKCRLIEDWWSVELILDKNNIFELYTKIKEYLRSKYTYRLVKEKKVFFRKILPYLLLLHSKKALAKEEKEEFITNIKEGKILIERKEDISSLLPHLLESIRFFVRNSEFYDAETGFKLTGYENVYIF